MSVATEPTNERIVGQTLPVLSSAGLPFGKSVPRVDEEPTSELSSYDGLTFEPFARSFQHVDHAVSRPGSDEAGDSSKTEPFGCQFAQSAYSHHDGSEATATLERIRYDEDTQTVVFPPGVVAGKGWCRRWTYWRYAYDTVRD